MTARRQCKGQKPDGTPCQANPLISSDYCLAHSDRQARESVGFRADNGKGGRPPKPRVVDVLKERIEEDMELVLEPLIAALEADTTVVIPGGKDAGTLEFVPDHKTRIAAARELLDRAYGKPKAPTELSGPQGSPITLAAADMSDPEVRKWALDMIRERVAGNTDD